MPSFYIPPNGVIMLCRDVPIDQGMEHTLWFNSETDQMNYFYSKAFMTLNQQYYTRQNRGVIKAEVRADDIYNANYLMYRNIGFGNKWFYAFITSIEYTNNNTATITFVIDQMQTWFFEIALAECFVEREHSATDVPGENTVPEGLETGEFIYTDPERITALDPLMIVIAATFYYDAANDTFVDASGLALSGMYTGIHYSAFNFDATGIQQVNTFLLKATQAGKESGIVSVFMCPQAIMVSGQPTPFSFNYTYTHRPTTIQGYTPRNNKLLTAPYVTMFVKTPTNAAEYAWEYFLDPNNTTFKVINTVSTSPSSMLVPKHYKTVHPNVGTEVEDNYIESLTLNGYPQCAYNIDAFKAWLAQNGASLVVNSAMAVGGLALGVAKAKATAGLSEMVGGGSTALSNNWTPPWEGGGGQALRSSGGIGANATIFGSLGAIGNILAQIYQHSILPPHARGNADGNVSLANGLMNFLFFTKTIRIEYAQIIDQYFDKFGYATHRVKVPNVHVRRYWTYVKTVDCIIHGNIPTQAVNEIQSIFNRGVTFWADPGVVGNYYLPNTPLV